MSDAKNLPLDLPLQGARAVRSGRYGEGMVTAAFFAYAVRTVNDNPEFHYEPQLWPRTDMLLIRQHRLVNNRVVDFLFKNFKSGLTLPIECKQQMGSGTTDEKLSYTVDALVDSGHLAFWLVLSGGGFNPTVTKTIEMKIRKLKSRGICGRLVFNEGPFLQRAVERLVERNEA